MKYTCLFGGGAVRGIAYVGVIKALEELNIQIKTSGGSSVGSIIAVLAAVGYSADEIEKVFLKVNFDLFKDVELSIRPKLALSKGEVFLKWIRGLIESKYYGKRYVQGKNNPVTFADLDKNLVIITTDLSNYDCKEFSRFETPDYEIAKAIRISCTMPGLMRPIEYDNAILVDGDLQKSWPMWKLSKNFLLPDERVLEFRLEGYTKEHEMNAINFANTIYSCMTAMSTTFIVDIYGKKDKFDYVVLNTGDIIIVDFNLPREKRKQLISLGYEQTIAYFKKELPRKKAVILAHYKKISTHIAKIKKLIDKNKPVKAKAQVNELFGDLCELNKIIDLADYEQLKEFRTLFFANIKYPSLFGKVKLKNEEQVKSAIDEIKIKISEKIAGFEAYLSEFPL